MMHVLLAFDGPINRAVSLIPIRSTGCVKMPDLDVGLFWRSGRGVRERGNTEGKMDVVRYCCIFSLAESSSKVENAVKSSYKERERPAVENGKPRESSIGLRR